MKWNTSMPTRLNRYYQEELSRYRNAFRSKDWSTAWKHLERAHILGQSFPLEHTRVHWLMLRFGFTMKDRKEILGQLPRLLVGGVKSFVGKVPLGNTGGANVPPLRTMEIPDDLRRMLEANGVG